METPDTQFGGDGSRGRTPLSKFVEELEGRPRADRLAVSGGAPACATRWPVWPQYDGATVAAVTAALRSDRWTVSGGWTGSEPLEREVGRRFAEFCGVPYAVATDHGTSALMLALEALGVGAGDEVVVPVLTWVATATAVLNVGAVPVFADVDPATGCLSAQALAAAVTERTTAVIVVHLHCRMTDMDAVGAVAAAYGLGVVEDCAQAHGAVWAGRVAGSIGDVGAFSMQQGKVLTCGEGGAVTTADAGLYDRLQQLRADSRRYASSPLIQGYPGLVDVGGVMGTNHCLPELSAALLLDQLGRLPAQVMRRDANARLLDAELGQVQGLAPLAWPARLEVASVFEYAVRRDGAAFGGASTDRVCAALSAELGVRVMRTDAPLHRNALYCPLTKPRYRHVHDRLRARRGVGFPAAEKLYEDLILLPHRVLLAEAEQMRVVVAAFAKVSRLASGL